MNRNAEPFDQEDVDYSEDLGNRCVDLVEKSAQVTDNSTILGYLTRLASTIAEIDTLHADFDVFQELSVITAELKAHRIFLYEKYIADQGKQVDKDLEVIEANRLSLEKALIEWETISRPDEDTIREIQVSWRQESQRLHAADWVTWRVISEAVSRDANTSAGAAGAEASHRSLLRRLKSRLEWGKSDLDRVPWAGKAYRRTQEEQAKRAELEEKYEHYFW